MGKTVNKMFFTDTVFKIILFIKDFDTSCLVMGLTLPGTSGDPLTKICTMNGGDEM